MYAYPLKKSHKLEPDQLMQANIQHTRHVNQIASMCWTSQVNTMYLAM